MPTETFYESIVRAIDPEMTVLFEFADSQR